MSDAMEMVWQTHHVAYLLKERINFSSLVLDAGHVTDDHELFDPCCAKGVGNW